MNGSVGLSLQRWVAWSAVWVGALTALAAALIIGLIGVALGAHELVPPRRVVRVRDFGLGAALFSVVGALLAFGAEDRDGRHAPHAGGVHEHLAFGVRAIRSQCRPGANG
jgi:hypothetical protein